MTANINRRNFLKKSIIASTSASLGLSPQEKALLAAPAGDNSIKGLPTGKIGNVQISRLITGENQFSGWSHSRDLKYLRELFKAYNPEEKIMETLQICEEMGVNTIITASSGYLNKYWSQRGGRIQWIAQTHPKVNDLTSNIKRAIDNGAIGAYVQGGVGDRLKKTD
ncbi:MAG: hypothetical protein ACYS91_13245 [Planctomycetota bacterium]|jgi:hypothetical protein